VLPPLALVVVVLGSIYGGITSITEAAGIGCVGALAIIAARRELNLTMLLEALTQTFRAVGTIIWVTFGATILAGAYNLAGGSTYVANLIIGLELPPLGVILLMMLIFLLLGMFMDWVGIVLLAMPVFLPIVTKLGYDPVWFGILFCINMQVSFLSPPFGPAAFYLKSVAPPEISLVDIYKSFGPFICLQLLVLALVLFFPWLAMALL
jgi:tripartite ATP-independent transporter DctM subunit